MAGEIAEFTVQARDPWSNLRSDDGDGGATYTDGRLDYRRRWTAEDPGVHDTFNVGSKLLSTLSSVNTPSHLGLNYRGCAGGGSISSRSASAARLSSWVWPPISGTACTAYATT